MIFFFIKHYHFTLSAGQDCVGDIQALESDTWGPSQVYLDINIWQEKKASQDQAIR